jgi:uncharacterized protein
MSTASSNKRCALCGKPAVQSHAPFCSQGCRDRDLLNWLGEGYRVPGPPAEDMSGNSGVDEGHGLDSER